MPYRRLPNTDAARLRALETAMNKSMKLLPAELAISSKTLQRLRFFLPSYKQNIQYQKETLSNQVQKNTVFLDLQKKTRQFISHFVQVLNMAISRDEFPESVRKYYHLEEYGKKVPPLHADVEIIDWGKKIIEGEMKRIAEGGTPIANPRIALVRVKYEQFLDSQKKIHFLKTNTNRAMDKVSELRKEADDIILNIWNEVEEHYKDLDSEERRVKGKDYGLVYVFRKNELV